MFSTFLQSETSEPKARLIQVYPGQDQYGVFSGRADYKCDDIGQIANVNE